MKKLLKSIISAIVFINIVLAILTGFVLAYNRFGSIVMIVFIVVLLIVGYTAMFYEFYDK